jgi:Spy/CpxP family protein refolding chaperone
MRSKSTAVILLISIFVLGGIAGAVSHYIYEHHFGPDTSMRPVPGRHDIVEQMSQSLKLDAQQKEKLKAIIQQSGERYSALSTQFRPQYDRIRAETNEAIRAVLRPDQRKLFEETLEKLDRRPRTRQRH